MRIIKNFDDLSSTKERRDVLEILEAGLKTADPRNALKSALKLKAGSIYINNREFRLSAYSKILVLGMGKATGYMAEAVEEILGDIIDKGLIIVPKGTADTLKLKRIKVLEGTHPIPSEDNVIAAKRFVEILEETDDKTLVIFLISGGGSALLTYPADGISLQSVKFISDALMKAGADIFELNTVRKHISAVKGGQLARIAHPATVISLIISDVIGDDLSVIASGPTVPDPSTYKDAYNVLKRYELWENAPEDVRSRIEAGIHGKIPETPKPGDPVFKRVYNFIIASNMSCLSAMLEEARRKGYNASILTPFLEGEAREVAKVIGAIGRSITAHLTPLKRPAAVIFGGETTVTVKGGGLGGRNQEMVLATALRLPQIGKATIASMGTDGIDGPTDAAGAIADESTIARARKRGLDPTSYLENNDSYTFFKKLNDLIYTGPTGTNVGDIGVLLIP